MYDPTAIEDLPSGHVSTVTWYSPNTACLHCSLLSGELPAIILPRSPADPSRLSPGSYLRTVCDYLATRYFTSA